MASLLGQPIGTCMPAPERSNQSAF